MAKTSKRQHLSAARESVEKLWQELDKGRGELHQIAQHGIRPDDKRANHIANLAVTVCVLELSCRAVEQQTNFGLGSN